MSPMMSSFGDDPAPGSPVSPPPRIDGFTISGLAAGGGMGLVYEAWQDHPHRRVAIKLPRLGAVKPEWIARLGYEAEILGRLEHPAIARVYAAGSVDHQGVVQPYLIMEWIEGRTITEHATSAQLSVADRLTLFLQIIDGVHFAHQQGIIHRDLKPGNILVDARGQPKILDFGIARITAEESASLDEAPVESGTLNYMAPEQFGGHPENLDVRSDVYALGVVLYELLTGAFPYPVAAASRPEIRRMIREEKPLPLRRHVPGLSVDLEMIVAKALEKNRDARYGSALALGEDLRRYLDHRPVDARPHTSGYLIRTFTRRHRLLVGASAAVIAGITIGLVSASMAWNRARIEEQRARANLNRALDTIDQFTTFVVEGQLASMPGAAPIQERLLQDAVYLYDALIKDNADDAFIKEEMAWALAYLARLKTREGDAGSASVALQRQVEQWQSLIKSEPARAHEHRRALARTQVLLGRALDRDGDRDAAKRMYVAARQEYQILREADPADREVREEFAYMLGNWAQSLDHPGDQLPLYEAAVAEWRSLRQDFPSNRDIERGARWAEDRLAEFGSTTGATPSADTDRDEIVLEATDRNAILAAVGKQVVVKGRIQEVAMNRGRDRFTYVNFGRDTEAFFGIIHRNSIDRFMEAYGRELEALPGCDVEMRGVVAIHRNRPELVLNQPSQIKLLNKPPTAGEAGDVVPEISSRDLDALRAQAGRTVTITGRLYDAGTQPNHKVTYLDFENANGKDKAVGIIPQQYLNAVSQSIGGHPAMLKGRNVKITGRVYLYRGNPNIEIKDPSQLVVMP